VSEIYLIDERRLFKAGPLLRLMLALPQSRGWRC